MTLPPVPVAIPLRWFNTPRGLAYCDLMVHGGTHGDTEWLCTVLATGQQWSFTNIDVRAVKNITLGMDSPENPWRKPDGSQ